MENFWGPEQLERVRTESKYCFFRWTRKAVETTYFGIRGDFEVCWRKSISIIKYWYI